MLSLSIMILAWALYFGLQQIADAIRSRPKNITVTMDTVRFRVVDDNA